jgi:hypothetical protein
MLLAFVEVIAMRTISLAKEITTKLKSLEPNKVVTLSADAGKFLLETVRQMKKNGEI